MATLDSLWRVRLIALASQIMKVAPAQISCAPGDLNANVAGTDDGVTFCGTSAIIDPYGAIVAAASVDREELIQAEISEECHQVRPKPNGGIRPSSTRFCTNRSQSDRRQLKTCREKKSSRKVRRVHPL